MTHPHALLLAASLIFLLTAPAETRQGSPVLGRALVAADHRLPLSIAKDSTLEIRGGVGDITVSRAQGEQTIVSAARDAGVMEPRIELVRHAGGVTICAVYPSPNAKKPNECLPGEESRLTEGVKKSSPSVHFVVEIPDGVHFLGRLAYGNFDAKPGRSDVDLTTTVGNISIVDNGSRTIQAAVAKGNLTATISGVETPANDRHVRFNIATGEARVLIPTTLPIQYTISSDRPIDTSFSLEEPVGTMRTGQLGPPGRPSIFIDLSSRSQLAKLVLLPTSE